MLFSFFQQNYFVLLLVYAKYCSLYAVDTENVYFRKLLVIWLNLTMLFRIWFSEQL